VIAPSNLFQSYHKAQFGAFFCIFGVSAHPFPGPGSYPYSLSLMEEAIFGV
jgi:hypothetical protein